MQGYRTRGLKPLGHVHGGVHGITSEAEQRPAMVKLCNQVLWQNTKGFERRFWTFIRLSCNGQVEQHVDSHNCAHSLTFVVPLSVFAGGRVVVGDEPQDFGEPPCVAIGPRVPHHVEPSQGVRLVVIGYTPRNGERMSLHDRFLLSSMGFPLPPYMQLAHLGHRCVQTGAFADSQRPDSNPSLHPLQASSCSCELSCRRLGGSSMFSLCSPVHLADIAVQQLDPTIQWSLVCIANPHWVTLQEDVSAMQEQLLRHRRLLRDVVQHVNPKHDGLGGSVVGVVDAKEVAADAKEFVSIKSLLASHQEPSVVGLWECIDQEAVKLETVLGFRGLGSSARLRGDRLRDATKRLEASGQGWLDVVTASLCAAKLQEESEEAEEAQKAQDEVMLQPRTLSMSEVYKDLEAWIPALAEELQALTTTHGAIQVVSLEDIERMTKEGYLIETIPSKIVPTLKPPNAKKRARIVGCGNFVDLRDKSVDESSSLTSPVSDKAYDRRKLYASGVDIDALRIQLRFAAGHACVVILVNEPF